MAPHHPVVSPVEVAHQHPAEVLSQQLGRHPRAVGRSPPPARPSGPAARPGTPAVGQGARQSSKCQCHQPIQTTNLEIVPRCPELLAIPALRDLGSGLFRAIGAILNNYIKIYRKLSIDIRPAGHNNRRSEWTNHSMSSNPVPPLRLWSVCDRLDPGGVLSGSRPDSKRYEYGQVPGVSLL